MFPQLPIVDMFRPMRPSTPIRSLTTSRTPRRCRGLDFVYAALKAGQIAQIDRVYPMEQYRDAWDYLSQPRESHGKVVVETCNAPAEPHNNRRNTMSDQPTDFPACVRSCTEGIDLVARTPAWHGFWTCDRTVTSALWR